MSKYSANTQSSKQDANLRSNALLMNRPLSLGHHVCIQRDGNQGVQPHASPLVREVLSTPGQPLDAGVRASLEPQFGYDFSGVRVHTDERASESAQAVGANAYTAGTHIAFGAGRYAPNMTSGRNLIAHELTHVAQQSEGDVGGSSIDDGLRISHPNDSFERSAAANQAHSDNALPSKGWKQPSEQQSGEIHLQRDSLGLSTGQGDTTKNANTAAGLSAWSALGGAIGGLASAAAAVVGLKFARRQAEAAEDPPVAEPTTGGVNSTHIELPEVKGFDPEDLTDTTEEDEEQTVTSGLKGSEKIPEEQKTSLTKQLKTRKHTKKTVTKKADDAEQEKSFTVLRLQQGQENMADFLLTLRYNGKDVKGGATEDGPIAGYLGGSAESNAAVTFRASPGAPRAQDANADANKSADNSGKQDSGARKKAPGIIRLLFGGTNVPPRKKPSGSMGWFGSAKTEDYKVQRFSATARFTGAGEFQGFDTLVATPRDRSAVQKGKTGGPDDPLVTIALATSDIEKAKQFGAVNPSAPQVAPPPPSKKP